MHQADSNQTESILGISWEDEVPSGRILNLRTDTIQKVTLMNYQLNYRIHEPVNRICLGYRPVINDQEENSTCAKIPEKGRKCESCKRKEQIFAAELHHAHTRDRSSLSAEIITHLERTNYLYIAIFGDGSIKVGTSTAKRVETRLLEQGAFFASIICETSDGFIVRTIEDMVTNDIGLVQAISTKRKMKGILHPISQNAMRETLKDATDEVSYFLRSLPLNGYSMILENWDNPVIESPCWKKVLKYPKNLSSGTHDLTLVSICGRIGVLQRESETEFYAADLDEIFGIILEPGNFPPEDFTIQGELF